MKIKNPTISVGISVFNEEKNLPNLLNSVLSQKGTFTLLEIIVISDGSTDSTVELTKKILDKRVKIIQYKKREGKVQRFNELVSYATSDYLIVLDADVILSENDFISQLLKPIVKNEKVGLVGARTISAKPQTFFERIIADSHESKQKMYEKINGGNTIYLCHGRARCIRRKLYTQMYWFNNCPEDSQSYFLCIQKGFLFRSTPHAKVTFRSPATFSDHVRQHDRFISGQKKLQDHFPDAFVREEYHIPKRLLIEFFLRFFLKNPISMISYVFITFYLCYLYKEPSAYTSLWPIAYSTKEMNV